MNTNYNLPDGVLACDLADGIDWDEAFERKCECEDEKAKIEREDEAYGEHIRCYKQTD